MPAATGARWRRRALAGGALAALAAAAAGTAAGDDPGPAPGVRVELPETVEVAPDTPARISLTLVPAPGHAISREAPVVVDLASEPPGALALRARRYRRDDAADARAAAPRFDLRLRAVRAGRSRLAIRARFWVCRDRSCWPADVRDAVRVEARNLPSDAGPAGDGGSRRDGGPPRDAGSG